MNFLSQIRRLSFRFFVIATWFLIVPIGSPTLLAQLFDIPQPLLPWKEWSRWDEKLESVPTLFDNPRASTPSWSSTLQMEILPDKGLWQLDVQVFADSWVHLPGDAQNWPQAVLSNGAPIAVLLHEDHLQQGCRQVAIAFKVSLLDGNSSKADAAEIDRHPFVGPGGNGGPSP